MEIAESFRPASRTDWRRWLTENHASKREIWLLLEKQRAGLPLSYLDAVEEALCFGWIDGIAKSLNATDRAQRFTPRAPGSNWTELNKERARRLSKLGLMTDAGRAVLPDLTKGFTLSPAVERALRADSEAWSNFAKLPPLYQRVRVGYIQEQKPESPEFEKRLANFVMRTARGEMFGNWTDGGRLPA